MPAKPSRDQPGGSGDAFTRLNWIFEITQEGDYFGKNVRAETSAFLSDSPFNQFRNWAEALLQPQLDLGQVLDESDLIGLPALITVKHEEDRKDSSKKWARVDEVISVGDAFAERPSELIPAGLGQSRPARPPISHPVRGGQRGLRGVPHQQGIPWPAFNRRGSGLPCFFDYEEPSDSRSASSTSTPRPACTPARSASARATTSP